MIRITKIAIPVKELGVSPSEAGQKERIKNVLQKKYRLQPSQVHHLTIQKRSLDARKKGDIKYFYTVDVAVEGEKKLLSRYQEITVPPDAKYGFLPAGSLSMKHRPVVIGFGPAGMFCALELARSGYEPIVLERGKDVDARVQDVESFWAGNGLHPESNVQFGEGGAGTFSDGKLNTMVKDPCGRHRKVLQTLVDFGAPEEILYQNKPHIGTDYLRQIVKNIRSEILLLGGEIRFQSRVAGFQVEDGRLTGVYVGDKRERLACEIAVLAVGHSARDTFAVMKQMGVRMEPKAFAVGFRMEHDQERMNGAQYGDYASILPPADYKVTYRSSHGRNIYSFCMCPGGFVVNASSEPGRLAVNGMSNHDRGERNANSAMIVSVTPEDFNQPMFLPEQDLEKAHLPLGDPLLGVEFQRCWEQAAYREGDGRIPVQRFQDFKEQKKTEAFGHVRPNMKGAYAMADLNQCLPAVLCDCLKEAVSHLGTKLEGFNDPDAVLSGVETRTSSPVRILRDDSFQSNLRGIYPCGEGAGYAGGITSAAMDGIRVYEAVASQYRSFV